MVKTGLEGMVAGQIASELAIAPNNLSFHLKAMTHAGLLSVAHRQSVAAFHDRLWVLQPNEDGAVHQGAAAYRVEAV